MAMLVRLENDMTDSYICSTDKYSLFQVRGYKRGGGIVEERLEFNRDSFLALSLVSLGLLEDEDEELCKSQLLRSYLYFTEDRFHIRMSPNEYSALSGNAVDVIMYLINGIARGHVGIEDSEVFDVYVNYWYSLPKMREILKNERYQRDLRINNARAAADFIFNTFIVPQLLYLENEDTLKKLCHGAVRYY